MKLITLTISDNKNKIWINPERIVSFYQVEINDENDKKRWYTQLRLVESTWPVDESPTQIIGKIEKAEEL